MELCVGLDVGLEETSICVIDREGKVVRETMVSTEPAAIRCALVLDTRRRAAEIKDAKAH